MERLLNLTRRGRNIVSPFLGALAFLLGIEVFYLKDNQFTAALIPIMGLFLLSLLLFFKEKKDDVAEISKTLDHFLEHTLPETIEGRFLGEPFDSHRHEKEHALHVDVYYVRGQHHAGYRVGTDEYKFEFTCIIGVYRIAFFVFLPPQLDEASKKALTDVCDAFRVGEFTTYFEEVTLRNGASYTVVYLNKTLSDHYSEFVFSAREQYWIASLSSGVVPRCRSQVEMRAASP